MFRSFFYLFLMAFISLSATTAQPLKWEPVGDWGGALQVQSIRMTLVFHLKKNSDGSYAATMDSPMQSAYDLPMDKTEITDTSIVLTMNAAKAKYVGKPQADGSLAGEWQQAGKTYPLALRRDFRQPARPQHPIAPYPYATEEVVFDNKKAGIKLAGTLSYPKEKGRYPAVILISGSGAQNRDEEILGHKPFLVIADYLTRAGYAVLRFDDRGYGKSTGNHGMATTADFATDVEAAFAFLEQHAAINPKKIGLIGHSEGGMIAPIVAARQKKVAFIILLAAPGLPMKDLLIQQTRDIGLVQGTDPALLDRSLLLSKAIFETVAADKKQALTVPTLLEKLEPTLAGFSEEERVKLGISHEYLVEQLVMVLTPWMRYALAFDPEVYLSKVKCPVLAINGDKDLQVSVLNMNTIGDIFEKSKLKQYTLSLAPGLNHLFQHCKTGSPAEYGEIEETFAVEVLEQMAAWMGSTVK